MKVIVEPIANVTYFNDVCPCLWSDSSCSDCEFDGADDCSRYKIPW